MQQEPAARRGPRFGAIVSEDGIRFAVWSGTAKRVWASIFDDEGDRETERLELSPEGNGVFARFVPGLKGGTRYGFRADGDYAPERGLWFDPDKLLVDPYAVELDRPYVFDPRLSAQRGEGGDTALLMPKTIACSLPDPVRMAPPLFTPGGFIYEVSVRAFTMLHPDIPKKVRGTIAALAHPAVVKHMQKLGVSAVELMPVTAWIDERHLAPIGLTNAWGYNPVTFTALDPRLAPGGVAELRQTVSALREAGIGVILDLVFNHTGESDALGPTLSLRGLDNQAYYRHVENNSGRLVNDTGTGNTLACDHPIVRELILDSLRHFVLNTGVDGFRFDLAPILGRSGDGFDPHAALLTAMRDDPVLGDRVMIAEPWDIGPGGYQLGNFPDNFLEWNDRYRDDIRRFWRGDANTIGSLATRLAGSSDVFRKDGVEITRSVNFIAAHDGMTLADLSRYERKHNEANGEQNRDGHNENFSWNNGVEGESKDAKVKARRAADSRAFLATLFASRGTMMLTAGDEFGRTQKGDNNAYAQDNEVTWLDWQGRDLDLEAYAQALASFRKRWRALVHTDTRFLDGNPLSPSGAMDVEWLSESGQPLDDREWQQPDRRRLTMVLASAEGGERIAILINGDRRATVFNVPAREGFGWTLGPGLENGAKPPADAVHWRIDGRSVAYLQEARLAETSR